jgi:hypothetical protein
MGMALAPSRSTRPAAADPDAVGDHPTEDEDHPDDHDEMSRVLAEREAGDDRLVRVGGEAVLGEVKDEPERDDRETELGRSRERSMRRRERVFRHSGLLSNANALQF